MQPKPLLPQNLQMFLLYSHEPD